MRRVNSKALSPVDILGLAEGRQRYALFTNAAGGILDNLMVASRADHLFLVVNAACKDADAAHLRSHLKDSLVEPVNRALLALQGPGAEAALSLLTPDVARMRFMDIRTFSILGSDCSVSRSGYTGEDGFEISVATDRAEELSRALLDNPAVAPIGLGARDSLRLEAGLCLYGSDLDDNDDASRSGARMGAAEEPPDRRRAARRFSGRGDHPEPAGVGRATPSRRVAAGRARADQRRRQDIFRRVGGHGDWLGHFRGLWSERECTRRYGLRRDGVRGDRSAALRGICAANGSKFAYARCLLCLRDTYAINGRPGVMLKFTKDHEWLRIDGDVATVGITQHAQEQLGDLVFVELPTAGATFAQGAPAAVVELVKAASDVYAPVSGEIVEINPAIVGDPTLVNRDPMGEGWFVKIKITEKSQLDKLMDEQAYKSLIA